MSLKIAFARELYRARTKSGYSLFQVANAVGISLRWYQYLEKGGHMPSAEVLLQLMILLGIEATDFRETLGMTGMYFYCPVEQHLYSPETGNYVTYGIRVSSEGGESLLLNDVSCDRIRRSARCALHAIAGQSCAVLRRSVGCTGIKEPPPRLVTKRGLFVFLREDVVLILSKKYFK